MSGLAPCTKFPAQCACSYPLADLSIQVRDQCAKYFKMEPCNTVDLYQPFHTLFSMYRHCVLALRYLTRFVVAVLTILTCQNSTFRLTRRLHVLCNSKCVTRTTLRSFSGFVDMTRAIPSSEEGAKTSRAHRTATSSRPENSCKDGGQEGGRDARTLRAHRAGLGTSNPLYLDLAPKAQKSGRDARTRRAEGGHCIPVKPQEHSWFPQEAFEPMFATASFADAPCRYDGYLLPLLARSTRVHWHIPPKMTFRTRA
mmetsp:Transcript_32104/g.73918  ORF Transcript_32104/g.73918 Transcript_32104/m.73918 type:complete len:255 (+) Transcript_32104:189-953(+)